MSLYSKLFLRTKTSPYGDFTRNSVLSFDDLDQNFLFLKERDIQSFSISGTVLNYNTTGGDIYSINLSSIVDASADVVWKTGTTGNFSIRAINDSGLDATGNYSVAQGYNTTASGPVSHAQGGGTIASGLYSHAEGLDTTASGDNSHAGGNNSTASGDNSFIHSTNSLVSGARSAVLGGQNITGTTDDTVYVPNLNIGEVGGGTSVTNLGVDIDGNVVSGTTGGGTGTTYWEATADSNLALKDIKGVNTVISGTSDYSMIAGGSHHSIFDGTRNGILGGYNQTVNNGANNAIVGGRDHIIQGSSNNNLMGGGDDNTIENGTKLSVVLGGAFHDLRQASKTVIIGGQSHETNTGSSEDAIIGGYDGHFTNTQQTVMLGGKGNFTNTNNTGAVSSVNLNVNGTSHSFFGGGEDHTGSSNHAAIIGGSGHTISGNRSVILGGINITATASDTVYVPNLEVRGQAYTPIYDNLTGGTTFVPDWDNSNVQTLTLSGNTNVSGGTSTMKGGSAYTMIIKQSNGGSHTITWDSTYKWEAGSPPTLTVADGSVDIITFICDGTYLYGLIAKDFQ